METLIAPTKNSDSPSMGSGEEGLADIMAAHLKAQGNLAKWIGTVGNQGKASPHRPAGLAPPAAEARTLPPPAARSEGDQHSTKKKPKKEKRGKKAPLRNVERPGTDQPSRTPEPDEPSEPSIFTKHEGDFPAIGEAKATQTPVAQAEKVAPPEVLVQKPAVQAAKSAARGSTWGDMTIEGDMQNGDSYPDLHEATPLKDIDLKNTVFLDPVASIDHKSLSPALLALGVHRMKGTACKFNKIDKIQWPDVCKEDKPIATFLACPELVKNLVESGKRIVFYFPSRTEVSSLGKRHKGLRDALALGSNALSSLIITLRALKVPVLVARGA